MSFVVEVGDITENRSNYVNHLCDKSSSYNRICFAFLFKKLLLNVSKYENIYEIIGYRVFNML